MDFLFSRILKPWLLSVDPEKAHDTLKQSVMMLAKVPGGFSMIEKLYGFFPEDTSRLTVNIAGLKFLLPVGLGAGFDKTGELFPFLSYAGFGFVESGTFTAHEQPGNPKPRIFRYPDQGALVNRMGFNNPGADQAALIFENQLSDEGVPGVIRGINIGKSKITDLEKATEDYVYSVKKLAPFADYVSVNISSPNTAGLRDLQSRDYLQGLLEGISGELSRIVGTESCPLFLKIAPDLSEKELEEIIDIAYTFIDALILTNTTLDHSALTSAEDQQGGLSGKPLKARSTEMIRKAYRLMGNDIPIIGVGGIFSGEDALEKIQAGASLVQVYTGYIYEGPALPSRISRYLYDYCLNENVCLQDVVGMYA